MKVFEDQNFAYSVGSAVQLTDVLDESHIGTVGVVYDIVEDGIYIILENGHDDGHFSPEDQNEWLEY